MSDWIEWKGGDCPVAPDVSVEVRFRDGTTDDRCTADAWSWREYGSGCDIVAYRIAAPVAAPAQDDTRRLDWLAYNFKTSTVRMGGNHPYFPNHKVAHLEGPTFRAAIDAAMGAAPEPAPSAEPVAWQYQVDHGEEGVGSWQECSEERAKRLNKYPDINVRPLHAGPVLPKEGNNTTK